MNFSPLEKRVIELSYKHKLSHISSCLNCVRLLDQIYEQRKEDEPVICGNGHASLAHYVVLEKFGYCDAEEMIKEHGVHAHRDPEHGIWVSCGSLGQAETVSIGLALAYPQKTVWLVTSDGSCMEGAVYESMRIARKQCPNLKVFVVFNGFGAYGEIQYDDLPKLPNNATIERVDTSRYPSWLRGLAGHYLVLTDEQFSELMQ